MINSSNANFLGIGIDIVHIPSFERAMENSPNLRFRLFANSEIGLDSNSLAGNFAAKEATIKSLGQAGMIIDFRDIFVGRDDLGIPFIKIEEKQDRKGKISNLIFSISISHHTDYAIAIVLCFKDKSSILNIIKKLIIRNRYL